MTLLVRRVASLMPLSADPSITFPSMTEQAEELWAALKMGPRSGNLAMYDTVHLVGRRRQDKQKYQRQYIRAQLYIADTNTYLPADQESRVPAFYKKKKWSQVDMKKVTHLHIINCMITYHIHIISRYPGS